MIDTIQKKLEISYAREGNLLLVDERVNITIDRPIQERSFNGYVTSICIIKIDLPYSDIPLDSQLIFIKWLNRFGNKIKILCSSEFYKIQKMYLQDAKGRKYSKENKDFNKLLKDGWINDVLKKCTPLNHLKLENSGEIILDNVSEQK
jgi:hypothetical protein